MANTEHVKLVRDGIEAIREWRVKHPERQLDLENADLKGIKLIGGSPLDSEGNRTCSTHSDLSRENLKNADLSGSNLFNINISEADLGGANLTNARLVFSNLSRANLSNTEIVNGADLGAAILKESDLRGANITRVNVSEADLSGANLSSAMMHIVNFSKAELINTLFIKSHFSLAEFDRTNLTGADFTDANGMWNRFLEIDLSGTKGLETIEHKGPSTISIDTLYKSQGNVPEVFLRGCGVPEDFITYARSLTTQPIQFYSCFISYSSKDEEFAKRLHSRMRDAGLRVWFAPEDTQGGKKIHEQIDSAIQLYDRLLLVLSEYSMRSEWVITEIRKARQAEGREKRRKLFPIRLVSFDTLRDWECFDADIGKDLAVEVREYFIPDFSNWKEYDAFEAAFNHLHGDLRTEGSGEAAPNNSFNPTPR